MSAISSSQTFGALRCLKQTKPKTWLCQCSCGKEVEIPESWLLAGVARSCGCKKDKLCNLTGQRYGKLTVIEPVPKRKKDGRLLWLCLCDCGTYIVRDTSSLRMGHIKSCGCLRKRVAIMHKTFIDGTCMNAVLSEKPYASSTSGIRGVTKKRDKWQARVSYAKKLYYLGTYDTMEQAAAARQQAMELIKVHLRTILEDPDSATDIDTLLVTAEYPHRR